MSRRLHIRPRPGVNPFALLMFLTLPLGSGGFAKPARAQSRQEHPDGAKTILPSELELGKSIRLTFRDGSRQVWKLAGMTEREMQVFGYRNESATSIPYHQLDRIERRKDGNALLGFVGGTLLGFSAGFFATVVFVSVSHDPYAGYSALVLVPVGTVAGAVIGTAVGAAPRWETVRFIADDEYLDREMRWPTSARDEIAEASRDSELHRGQRLRLTFSDEEQFEVRLVHADEDSIRVRADRPYASTVTFAYDELASVEAWYEEHSRSVSGTAVTLGAGLGLVGGILLGSDEEKNSQTAGYAMAGLTLGAIAGGLLSARSENVAEWKKIFVLPQKDGVMVGYHTRF